MKQSVFTSGMIPSSDDFNFAARSKNYSIEQTRYDLLEQQSTRVKGVVKLSGLTSGHADEPLKVYITDSTIIHVYSGVAYDGYEGRSNRVWVPDDPADIPANAAAAVSNYDNIDMPDETLVKDFTTETRPPRTNIKEFTVADASGTWYVCIRHVYGNYDPITIPSDGSQANSKRYDTYVIEISQNSASVLFLSDGHPWIQLATLEWDGSTVWITSDDRVFASCTVTVDEAQIQLHQDRFHCNSIISEDRTKLSLVINNVSLQMELSNYAFASGEGMNINGKFIQTVGNQFVQFDPTMAAAMYYFYINEAGTFLVTITFSTANSYLFLGQCYWNGADRLQLSSAYTVAETRDRRRFGGIGRFQADWEIIGPTYDYDDNLNLEQAHNEFTRHRGYPHGNCIVIDPSSSILLPSGATSYETGSLGCKFGPTFVTVNDVEPDDLVLANSWVSNEGSQAFELRTLFPAGANTVTISGGAGRYLVYIERRSLAPDPLHSYSVHVRAFNGNLNLYDEYPLCTFYWNSLQVQIDALNPVVDRRIWGSVGYAHIQRNKNRAGNNNLPQLLVNMWGLTDDVIHGTNSGDIFLTHDWGTGTHGGGSDPTGNGQRVFATKPLLMAYVYNAGSLDYNTGNLGNAYYITNFVEDTFRIFNNLGATRKFYWTAIGPPLTSATSFIQGKNNPNYGETI